MHTFTRRRGFTLVELMVVIAIIATLMMLLLPAVNAAVESGRRTKCVANQTKIASAMAMYDSRNGFLPGVRNKLLIKSPGSSPYCRLWHTTGNLTPGDRPIGMSTPSWFIMLLPMLERQDLFDGVIGGQVWMLPGNAGTCNSGPRGLGNDVAICPSAGSWHSIARIWTNLFYRANGAGSASTPFKVDDGAIGDNANGIYATMADIAAGDGSANTLLITENDAGVWYPITLVGGGDSSHPCFFCCVNKNGGAYLAVAETGGGLLFGFWGTPNATTRIVNGGGAFPWSGHPGGAVAAFADGSTRFLRQDLKPHVYGHLVTRRSIWNGTTNSYSNNSALANGFLQCSPATKPYALKAEDY